MNIMKLRQWDRYGVLVFALLAFLHVTLFRLIPFPLGIFSLLIACLAGVIAFVLCAARIATTRQWSSVIGLAGLAIAAACWHFLPTEDYSLYIRFKMEEPRYDAAVRGERCTVPGGCLSSASLPGFLVFPYEGLSGWVGIVYAPGGRIDRLLANPQSFSSAVACADKPIDKDYFICGFD